MACTLAPCLFLAPLGWMPREMPHVLGLQVAYPGHCPFGLCLPVALSRDYLVRSVLEVSVCVVGSFEVGLLLIRLRIGFRYFVLLNGCFLRRCA